jgi:hypothetical protein
LDDYFTRDYRNNIGAEIMGRNEFGPQRGPWETENWTGWWGDTPPFRTPLFVLAHTNGRRSRWPTRPPTSCSGTGDPATGRLRRAATR